MRYMGFVLLLLVSPLAYAQVEAEVPTQDPKPVSQPVKTPLAEEKKATTQESVSSKVAQLPANTFEDRPTLNPSIDDEALNYKDAFMAFLKTILMLCVVLAFVYLLLGKGLPKLMSKTIQNSRMRVIERLPLDQKRSVFLIEVDDTTYLLGGSDQNLQLIDTLKKEAPDFQSKLDVKKASALKEAS